MNKGDDVVHNRWGRGVVLIPKVGKGIKCKFYDWPCPFIVRPKDLSVLINKPKEKK